MREPCNQKENPDSVAAEIGVEGIEALPNRVNRYGKSKKKVLDIAEYMAASTKHQAMAAKVNGCGDYLLFRHYYTVDKVKLHAAQFCKSTCSVLCAPSGGARRHSRPTLRGGKPSSSSGPACIHFWLR